MMAGSVFAARDPVSEEISKTPAYLQQDRSSERSRAEDVARHYVQHPDGRCAKLAARALRGDNLAKSEIRRFPEYCAWHERTNYFRPSALICFRSCAHIKTCASTCSAQKTENAAPGDNKIRDRFCSVSLPSTMNKKAPESNEQSGVETIARRPCTLFMKMGCQKISLMLVR